MTADPVTRGSGSGPIDEQADAWLVGKAQQGALQAYEVLIRRHRGRIYRIALRMLGDPHDAEDVTQDVIIQLWTALTGFSGQSMFTTWLYRIVVNRCLNHMTRSRQDAPLLNPDIVVTAGADAHAVARGRVQAVMRALQGLPAEQRAPVVLIDVEQLTYDEAARVLNVSEATVRGRLHRARRQLAETMREWA